MNIQTSVQTCLTKYIDFTGKATRSEYWWFVLVVWVMQVVASFVHPTLVVLVILATISPLIAVMVRRLHDSNTSGWLGLLVIIPIVNLVILYFMIIKGTVGPNRYDR